MTQILGKGFIAFLILAALPFTSFAEGESKVQSITAEAFLAKLKQEPNLNLLDVRTPEEFAAVKMPGAINVPLPTLNSNEDLQNALKPFASSKKAEVYVLCRSGRRATAAAEKFVAAGHKNLVVVAGGMNRLQDLGAKVEKK